MLHELLADWPVIQTVFKGDNPCDDFRRPERSDHQRLFRAEAVKERSVAYAEIPSDLHGRNACSAFEKAPPRSNDDLLIRDFLRSSHR